MQFIKHDLGQRTDGDMVEVTLTAAANVRLLDSSNLRMYRYGQKFKYIGGHYKHSPVQFEIPRSGHWYVVVDLGGHTGELDSSIRMLSEEALSG